MSIEVRHPTHCYGEDSALKTVALEDISFRVESGEFVGIVGHTGSGKSTLVQHLNGLLKPTSGQVLVDDVDLNADKTDRRALRQRIGLVFQYPEYQLFEETVEKDIAFGPRNQKLRRVAIAGVLAMKPSVLILDEPTAGLDPMGRDSILSMLEELHSRDRITVLMVSHSMDDMARLASRLLVFSEGRLIADGTPREIFAQEKMLSAAGLARPEAAQLCCRLREAGIPLPADLYRPEELKQHLLRLWKEGAGC